MDLAQRAGGMKFSTYDRKEYPLLEGVTHFQYFDRTLENTDNECTTVHLNIGKEWAVRRRLGKLLRREGADIRISDLFYRAVIHTVLLYGS